MAVDAPVLYNDWWVYLRDMVGGTYGEAYGNNPSTYQIHNAYKMRAALQAQGYCDKAIAGVIGNAQVESGITTGAIGAPGLLPNNGESLSDVPTTYMFQYYLSASSGLGHTVGLLQWDRSSNGRNDLINFANNYNYVWYDGDVQMLRLQREFDTDSQYHFWALNYGNDLTWAVYKDIENSQFSSYDVGECANVWASCWERSSLSPEGRQHRRDNAVRWYQYFIDHPTPPGSGLPSYLYGIIAKKRRILSRERKFF